MAADEQFKYDVAFSFLSQDEALAVQLNDRLKDRLETFIYSDAKRQAVLAGRDGADAFSRVFGAEARTVVVLYRAGWGESGFTAVEATAIRNRGFECSYDFTTFIPLDKPPIVPRWLGRSRLWFDWAKWGVEGAAAVIESRVQEAGGTPRELTAAELAARTVDEIREADERTAFLNSSKGVEAAQREFDALFEEVQRVSATSSGLVVKPERQKNIVSMDAAGLPRTVTFVFHLSVSDSLQGFTLRLVQFVGSSEGGRNWDNDYHFDFGPSGEYGWREGIGWGRGEFFSTARLVDRMATKLIEAVRDKRTNRPRRTNFITW
jgi:hypothetical protein